MGKGLGGCPVGLSSIGHPSAYGELGNILAKLLTEMYQIDLSQQYWNRVFEPALKVWEAGQTPNPDVWCNKCVPLCLVNGRSANHVQRD